MARPWCGRPNVRSSSSSLPFGSYQASPADAFRRVPGHRVGVSDQADFANEEVSMSPQTTPAELPVGHLGLGAMRITGQGIWGPPRDESEAIALLRRVVDRGVTFIDTADSYGPGISETLIAKALYPYPAGLMVATKGALTRPGADRWVTDCRPEHLHRAG